ncbi:MAG: hypothetical protein ACT6T3_18860, partial [Agrobacterium sp.]
SNRKPSRKLHSFKAQKVSNHSTTDNDALEITKVTGIEVTEIVEVTAGYELWPRDRLPEDFRNRLLFDNAGLPFQIGSSCALVHHMRHSRVIDPDYRLDIDGDWPEDRFLPGNMTRANKRLDIKRAIILSGTLAVSMPFTYCRATTDHILDADRSYYGSHEPTGHGSAKLDIDAVRSNLSLIENFRSPVALSVAIDRLGKARSWQSSADRALDLGMALEIALMHESGNKSGANTEITNKLSSRAAWLLGRDPAERKEAYNSAKKIYGHRSAAAHSGRLKREDEFVKLDGNGFVTHTLLEILRRGDFPVWDDLVLGLE